ncbi:Uncharacterized BCR%2C YitT family COG1284 [uncultured Clostridium sp.]|uniref:YczE/YyaS/YitT family protein n=1 Tax=uncultured Clostridium sp. TaxID=59620 RepID=UPI000821D507|nr:hypothetical protein [uncultured Clostridium sp.]SCJ06248.1 Uncharacterized BCR%2C YitT family COG1284 [uncultured Clostridium sp.]
MKNKLYKILRLIVGFILCASSTIFMLNSNLGLSPWDVFHQGLSRITGITIGQANIIIGVLFVIIGICFGQKLGVGTILNMLLIGQFIDLIMYLDIIPIASNMITGIIMMIIGMLLMGYGCYLYISCGLGCGPRDGVMLVLNKLLKKPIKYIRAGMEILVLILGAILGGTVGLGTVISAMFLGYSIQLVFKLRSFDVTKVEHKSIIKGLS